jgi:hypothetical protein
MNKHRTHISLVVLALAVSPEITQLLAQPLALTDASVVDVINGSVHKEQTVIVSGNRILAVGSSPATRIPKGAKVVDATGKYVIPGLWDSHVHTRYQGIPFLPLFILNGITSVRDAAGPWIHFEQITEWRIDIAAGRLLGPRILSAGPLLDGPNSRWSHGTIVNSPEEGRQTVREDKAKGADFVKIYELLSREGQFSSA